ncbi:cyclic nucleotide-binding domain-containing protein [Desulfobacca acetoxidans]|uniref:Putative transcriptional regulator, Crp/Fnr family n=1 Tax=Desulfobacca acetoxidans (strain ATCC 700848 / DSM 11109 / ASRB2) TaxID=880072 RepID=F2NFM6_DESAR|nr:cyclic nucleotide-binding domain-containing protein [Desulfobacca acetoxidans]AEB10145.1 putative transcriptional regulator, Crp/Fnr family [Desulfobacca acetoxidans DSM 11109]
MAIEEKQPQGGNESKNSHESSHPGPAELKISAIGTDKSFPKGSIIVRQGDSPDNFYVIRKGSVKVFRLSSEGIRTDLTTLGPGSYFGELAIITRQPRTAFVEAEQDTLVTEISREEFEQLLDDNPPLARQIIRQLTHWLVEGDRRLEKQVVQQVRLREISFFDYVLILGLSLIFALGFNFYNDNQIPLIEGWGVPDSVTTISVKDALERYQKNELTVIDARKDGFFQQEHIKEAVNFQVVFFDLMFPMYRFTLEHKQVTKDSPILIYGGTFSRRFDVDLALALKSRGYDNVMVLDNYGAWRHAFPLEHKAVKPPPPMDLGWAEYLEWIPVSIFVLLLLPPVRRSPYLSAFCRLILGIIFIQFALSKIMRPAVFALNVVDYQMMPALGVNLWALFLPWCELVSGLFLLLGIRTRAAATIIGGMNIMFITGLANAIIQGFPINCGCVGETGEPVNWWKVLKNTGMLVMTIQIFLYDRLFVLDRGGFVWRERRI